MLRIYDEFELRSRLRLKRMQVVTVLAVGCVLGFWFAHSGGGVALADSGFVRLAPSPALTPRWCDDSAYNGPRFDCTFSRK